VIATDEGARGGHRKFSLGTVVATANAHRSLPPEEVLLALRCHARCDWGDVDKEDWAANERALAERTRLLSVYHTEAGTKFWVITEADRSSTTVLLPEDY